MFTILILIILLFFPGNYFNKVLSIIIASLSAYSFHRLAHNSSFMNKLCGHCYHHQEKVTWINHLVEFISDILAAGGVLLIINHLIGYSGTFLLNNTTIIYFMISFPLVHLLNYHFFIPKSYHYYHHKRVDTNFSPDIYDHIFNTNDGLYFENLVHMIPIFLIIGIVIIYLTKKYKNNIKSS